MHARSDDAEKTKYERFFKHETTEQNHEPNRLGKAREMAMLFILSGSNFSFKRVQNALATDSVLGALGLASDVKSNTVERLSGGLEANNPQKRNANGNT